MFGRDFHRSDYYEVAEIEHEAVRTRHEAMQVADELGKV